MRGSKHFFLLFKIDAGAGKRSKGKLRIAANCARWKSLSELISAQMPSIWDVSTHPALRTAVADAIARAERVGSTGSRLLAGNAREWEELEREFADFAGTRAALYFTSGYAANVGVLSAVLGRGDIVFSDAANHASLIDGARLSGAEKVVFPHGDLQALELALHDRVSQPGHKLVVTESVFSMDGDLTPLNEMTALAKRYGAEMVVDEAHATGVFGPEGRGRVVELGLENGENIRNCAHVREGTLASMVLLAEAI